MSASERRHPSDAAHSDCTVLHTRYFPPALSVVMLSELYLNNVSQSLRESFCEEPPPKNAGSKTPPMLTFAR